MNNKSDLRKWAKSVRKNLNMTLISSLIVEKVIVSDFFKLSHNIMIFYPLANEVNLLPLLKFSDKNFYLPRINNDNLECCSYLQNDILKKSEFNTYEPISNKINPSILDLIFVPALAVDTNNYRLGYGKGFYDRFLLNLHALKIVPIAHELVVNSIYHESHDLPVDLIITQ